MYSVFFNLIYLYFVAVTGLVIDNDKHKFNSIDTSIQKSENAYQPSSWIFKRLSETVQGISSVRDATGGVLGGAIDFVLPGSCLGEKVDMMYVNKALREDDYGFVPNCGVVDAEANVISCFPENALLITPNHYVAMKDLRIGDLVATGYNMKLHGSQQKIDYIFKPIIGFLHRLPESTGNAWITLHWGLNRKAFTNHISSIKISPYHLVPVCNHFQAGTIPDDLNKCIYTAAKRVQVGDLIAVVSSLFNFHTNQIQIFQPYIETVITKSYTKAKNSSEDEIGLYAPITTDGKLIVNNIIVSQYSTLPLVNERLDNFFHFKIHFILKYILKIIEYVPSLRSIFDFYLKCLANIAKVFLNMFTFVANYKKQIYFNC